MLKVIRFLNDQTDPLMKIELLAAVAGTSEITICISDLAERALSSDAQEIFSEIETQCQTTSELFFLTYEENPDLLTILNDFLNENLTEESINAPRPETHIIGKIDTLSYQEEVVVEQKISHITSPIIESTITTSLFF